MTPIQMFGIYDDGVSSRVPSMLKAIYHTKEEAEYHKGAYRRIAPVWALDNSDGTVFLLAAPHCVPVGVDLDEVRQRTKEAALAKLTAEEREALGV